MTYLLYATCGAPGRRLQTFDLKNRLWGDEYETSLATKMAAKYMGIPLGGSPKGALSVSAMKAYGKMQIARVIGDTVTLLRICSIPDDHIDPRRQALFMARSILREVRDGGRAC